MLQSVMLIYQNDWFQSQHFVLGALHFFQSKSYSSYLYHFYEPSFTARYQSPSLTSRIYASDRMVRL